MTHLSSDAFGGASEAVGGGVAPLCLPLRGSQLCCLTLFDRETGKPLGREPKLRKNAAPLYAAYLGEELVCWSAQPLYAGARELLARGYDPATLLTTRWEGKGYDNFIPAPIGKLAKWTVGEGDRGMQRKRWIDPSGAFAQMRAAA